MQEHLNDTIRLEKGQLFDNFAEDFFSNNRDEPKKVALRLTAIYLVVGVLWILLSDRALNFFVKNSEIVMFASMIKGWVYVLATGVLIYILMCSSLNRIKDKEKKLQQLAYYDQLTGLRNRISLVEKLNVLIKRKDRKNFSIFFVDIDNFKNINDTIGHAFGDLLLINIGDKLVRMSENNWSIYRLSGDEFIILVENVKEIKDIDCVADKVFEETEKQIIIGNVSIFLTVSIGISIYPDHGCSVDELLKNADIAVYNAKEAGRNRAALFNQSMYEAVNQRMAIEKHLRTALVKDEFQLHYQPQLDIKTERVSGFEALIRWKNPELGSVPPSEFISIAEETQMIIPIGEWVIKNACSFLRRLHQAGYADLTVAVNVSILQLMQDNFADAVMKILEEAELDPKYLEMEVTESILMESYELVVEKLKKMRIKGMRIALDDFGKGYSSLNYLMQLPISTLKIDKSFVDTITINDKNKSLIDLIIKLGKNIGLSVIAEGVETQEQMDYLVKHKCNKIQGYLFCMPVEESEIFKKVGDKLDKNV